MCNGRNTGVQIARYAMCGKCKITLREVGGSVYKKNSKIMINQLILIILENVM